MTGATNSTTAIAGGTLLTPQDALDAFTKARKSIVSANKRYTTAEAFLVQTIGEGNSAVLTLNGDLVNITITNGIVSFSFVTISEVDSGVVPGIGSFSS